MKINKIMMIGLVAISLNATAAHAQWAVVAPISDLLTQLRGFITDATNKFQWAIDLQNKTASLANEYTTIQNQLTQIQQQYDSVKNFDANSISGFLKGLQQQHQRIDSMMNQTKGVLNEAGNLEDNMKAFMPRVEGMAELSPSQWKDFFAASEKQKQYSVENSVRDYDQIRKNYQLIKEKERELEDKNNEIQNPVQAARLTNEILLQQQEMLKNLNLQIGNQAMVAATAAIAAENSKNTINAEAKRVMTIQPTPVTSKGAGLFQLD